MDEPASIEALQTRLLDESDSSERAGVHLDLGRLALRDGRLEAAVRHLREALLLNRGLDAARELLRELGEEAVAGDRGKGPGLLRSVMSRLRGRTKKAARS